MVFSGSCSSPVASMIGILPLGTLVMIVSSVSVGVGSEVVVSDVGFNLFLAEKRGFFVAFNVGFGCSYLSMAFISFSQAVCISIAVSYLA